MSGACIHRPPCLGLLTISFRTPHLEILHMGTCIWLWWFKSSQINLMADLTCIKVYKLTNPLAYKIQVYTMVWLPPSNRKLCYVTWITLVNSVFLIWNTSDRTRKLAAMYVYNSRWVTIIITPACICVVPSGNNLIKRNQSYYLVKNVWYTRLGYKKSDAKQRINW